MDQPKNKHPIKTPAHPTHQKRNPGKSIPDTKPGKDNPRNPKEDNF